MEPFGNFLLKIVLCSFLLIVSNGNVIINSYTDECVLDPNLVKEINSYKDVTKNIVNEIKSGGLGKKMYQNFTKFIDTFGPRPSGSEVLERSIDYMVNLTKNSGIDDVTTERLKVPHWVRGFESAALLKPYKKKIALLGLGYSISTPNEGIIAPVIVVKNFSALDKMSRENVTGKIVVFDAEYDTYGNNVIYRTEGATKAAMKGAVAALIRSVTPFSIYSPHTGQQSYGGNVTKIPSACITIEDADLLWRMQVAGNDITIHLIMQNTFDYKESRNTIVDLKGQMYPKKQVIVSGHIDSWDVGQGAMDDGAGMMISWFVPVALKRLNLTSKRTIRAILWTSEELGLIGAKTFFDKHKDDLSNINFIMESDEGTFEPLGLSVAASEDGFCVIKEILKQFAPVDRIVKDSAPGSDINIVIRSGVPGASLINKNDRYFWFHHSEGDTMSVLNKDDVISCAAFWTAVTYVIADLSEDIPR